MYKQYGSTLNPQKRKLIKGQKKTTDNYDDRY